MSVAPPGANAASLPSSSAAGSGGASTNAPAEGGAGPSRSRDDQQIGQILAEMSQQQQLEQQANGGALSFSHMPAGSSGGLPSTASPYAHASLASLSAPLPIPGATHAGAFHPSAVSYALPHPPLPTPGPVSLPPLAAMTGAPSADAVADHPDEADDASPEPGAVLAAGTANETVVGGSAGGKGRGRGRGRGKSDERLSMNEEDWNRSRKDNHKEVERRRRETINNGITQLATLLPDANGSPGAAPSSSAAALSAASKVNKSLVLTRAAEYITQLRDELAQLKTEQARNIDQWTLEKLMSDQTLAGARDETAALRRENDALRRRVEELGGSVADVVNGGLAGKRVAEGAPDGGDPGKRARA
ncbi:hypothetical protein Rhopal_006772-T1 [Rhodotorula paludigena]|uniref:BHLH domain-containing protein n=1 Tax=Rhodotorula paludigena TaxID=86838 RepID=A0AAV5GUX0_9BASI|nr:hypothetical protein Rhopal_006772-T1 [Rhodotorula paludigena]